MKLYNLIILVVCIFFYIGCKEESTEQISSDSQNISHTVDKSPPALMLNGTNPLILTVNEKYIEFGANAIDDSDGNLTSDIKIIDNVDTATPGNYTVTYAVFDSTGNHTFVNRSIMVLSDNDIFKDNVFYVSPDGNDDNDGSFHNPFKSLQQAANIAQAGNIIYVREGIYDVGKGLIFTKSGTENNFITFTAFPRENPIIIKKNTDIWSNNFGATIAFYGVSYMKFNGFILEEPVGNAIFVTNYNYSNTIVSGSKHVEITNNVIFGQNKNVKNSLRLGYTIGIQNRKIKAFDPMPDKSSDILISRNYLYENYTGSLEESYNESLTIVGNVHNYVIENNILENNYFIGIDVIGDLETAFPMNTNGLIQNNLLIRNGKINQKGKRYTASLYVDGSENTIIRNNTILDSYGIGMVISQEEKIGTTKNITIESNYINNGAIYTLGVGTKESGKIENAIFKYNVIIQPNKNKENYLLARGNSDNIIFQENFFSLYKNLKAIKDENTLPKTIWKLRDNIYNSKYTKETFIKNLYDPNPKINLNHQTQLNIGVDPSKLDGVKREKHYDDHTPPIITLIGSNPQVSYMGYAYCEFGAIAKDENEGDISSFIISSSKMDTTIPGEYKVIYTIKDSTGNKTQKIRIVNVIDDIPPQPKKYIKIDQNENLNDQCPGEAIESVENLSFYYKGSFVGKIKNNWDIDHIYFSVATKGKINISLFAPKELTIKVGTLCDTENYYRVKNKKNNLYTFDVHSGDLINISILDWFSKEGYDYNLSLEFIPSQF